MLNLANLGLDENVKEFGSFTLVPAGRYNAVVLGMELLDNNKKTGKKLVIEFQITTKGEFYGTVIKDNLNLINPSKKAQDIAQGKLKSLCNITNVPYPPADASKMFGRPVDINVGVEEFESNNEPGKMLKNNKITGYYKQSVQAPAQSAQTQSAPPITNW